jgi:hypothetical protein
LEEKMNTSQKKIVLLTARLFRYLDFNLAKMPSEGFELDQLGGSHPESTKNKFQPVGAHLNQLLEGFG